MRDLREKLLPRFVSHRSIEAEFTRTVVLNPRRLPWRFFRGETEPPSDWKEPGFDASNWVACEMGLGYGVRSGGTKLDDMKDAYTTVYLRREFDFTERFMDPSLRIEADDGFVAFLNGVEIGRTRAGSKDQAVRAGDTATMPAPDPLDGRTIAFPQTVLRPGRNVLAIVGLNHHISSPDFLIRATLRSRRRIHPENGPLDAFLSLAGGPADEGLDALQEYVRARRLQRNGDFQEALMKLDALIAKDGSAPDLHLHAAQCLRALGDIEGARGRLRAALGRVALRRREIWEMWWILTAVESERSFDTMTRLLGEIPEETGPGGGYGLELRESLGALAAGGVLRLNCGGERTTSTNGAVWLRDRFFTGGFPFSSDLETYGAPEPFRGEIAGTDDDFLYQTERWFSPNFETFWAVDGYRIPLPPGDYEATMHFAEIHYRRPQRRLFEVVLEEGATVERLDLFAEAGFARPVIRVAEVPVRDGFLDIRFVNSRGEPKISAIEIRRVH